jgi:hypothetical protein
MIHLVCLLWAPAVYLFWREIQPESVENSGVAFFLGALSALALFFNLPLVEQRGRGLPLLTAVFFNSVGLVPLAGLVTGWLARCARRTGRFDLTGWTLFFLMPTAISDAINFNPNVHPLFLFLRYLLWAALALDAGFLFAPDRHGGKVLKFILFVPMVALPVLAAAVMWAFESQERLLGAVLLAAICLPAVLYAGGLFFMKVRKPI